MSLNIPGDDPAPASIASSASTVIAVELATTPDEEELYITADALARRPMLASQIDAATLASLASIAPSPRPGSSSAVSSQAHSANNSVNGFVFDDAIKQSASMSSSVRAHVYEAGIRYHAFRDGKYPFPNDEVEQNRDDMKHTLSLMLCHGAYFCSPIEQRLKAGGAQVLDLGTGTGIWPIEMGDRFPNTKIIGLDLSPIQPDFVPENVHFFVDDFEEDWVDSEPYDFIHVRHTMHSIRDRKALYRRALQNLKPGGYMEFKELDYALQCDDDTFTPDTPYAFRDYINYMDEGIQAFFASEVHAILSLSEEMKDAGFEDVRVITHKCPIGLWAREKRLRLCGLYLRTAIMDGLRGSSQRPLTALGWTQLQIEMFLVDVRKAVMDANRHVYFTYHVVYGRKPAD